MITSSLDFAVSSAGNLWLLLALAMSLVLFALRKRRAVLDIQNLHEGIRALLRNSPAPPMKLSSAHSERLWNLIVALSRRDRTTESSRGTYQEMIQMGSSLSLTADQTEATARVVTQLLLRQAGPEVCAAAVIRRDAASGRIRVEHSQGIPSGRLNEFLLGWFEKLIDGGLSSSWGYYLPQKGDEGDLSALQIGSSYVTPLQDHEGINGIIWLGLRPQSFCLTDEKRLFVQAICDHCAASFRTANRVQQRIDQTNREKDFLIGLSHDLRSPGNSALYALRDLLSDESNALPLHSLDRLRLVECCLEEQLDILGDVFDYTKHRRGMLTANRTPCLVRPIVETVFQHHRLHAEEKGIALLLDPIPPVRIHADNRHVRRVLGNLLGNAIKYTEHGSVNLTFSVTPSTLSISVSDTGIGVPVDERDFLFQEFSRLTNAAHLPGVGIGLAMCRALMSLNAGSLSYAAKSDGGSTFEATFERAQEEVATNGRKLNRVLIVDDDPATNRLTARSLHSLANEVVSASSAGEAKSILSLQPPDLLITDYYLGDETADSLIESAKQNELSVPTIVLSGAMNLSNQNWENERVLRLEKPLNEACLLHSIRLLFPANAG